MLMKSLFTMFVVKMPVVTRNVSLYGVCCIMALASAEGTHSLKIDVLVFRLTLNNV